MAIALSPAEIVLAARDETGAALPGLERVRLRRARVNGEVRLELMAFPPERREWLLSLGCFSEIIAYRTRLFLPPARAVEIIAAIRGSASIGRTA